MLRTGHTEQLPGTTEWECRAVRHLKKAKILSSFTKLDKSMVLTSFLPSHKGLVPQEGYSFVRFV